MFHNNVISYDYIQKIMSRTSLTQASSYGETNSVYFSDATGVIGFKSDGTKHNRLFQEIPNLTAGDVIEIACEVRSISGIKPRISFAEYGTTGNAIYVHNYQSEKSGEWETVNFKYTFRNSYGMRKGAVYIGLNSGDIGQFDLRHLRVGIKSKRNFNRQITVKPFEIRKSNGTFEIRDDFTTYGGTVSQTDVNTLRIVFDKPFNSRPVVTLGEDYSANGNQYNIRHGNLNVSFVEVKFYNLTGTLIPLGDIPESFHFGLVAHGWDVV